jgi:hypothetical protein
MHGYPQCLYPSEQSAKAGWQSKTLKWFGKRFVQFEE